MVIIEPTENSDKFRVLPDMPSWMNPPDDEPFYIDAREAAYIDLFQHTFKVEDATGKWIPKRLCWHQLLYHLDDVALKQELAPIRLVFKSRNTSLTVDTIESNSMAQAEFSNLVEPYVRLNGRSANDLMSQSKLIIKHMTPTVIEVPDESKRISPDVEPPMKKVYMPFNPNDVNLDNAGSITFPNGCQWRAFPANSDASETIRGLRLRGSGGFIDEANFMRYFKNIFVAMRDASAGSKDGKKILQFTIGSTLKGETPFSRWLEDMKKSGSDRIKIYDWPVFRRDLFDPYLKGKCQVPFHENDALVSIVPWHDKKELWETWLQDEHVFKEEYMAIKVESNEQYYPMSLIISAHDLDESLPLEELTKWLTNYRDIRIGMDPATINDYFAITVFGLSSDGHWEELMVEKFRKVDLPVMQQYCDTLVGIVNEGLKDSKIPWLCTIDATPIGLQLTQFLRKKYGQKHIRGVTGNKRIKDADGNAIKLNEYGHTTLKKMMYEKKIHLINDEVQMKHFTVWDYNYKAASSNDGHGDIVMAILYALLPRETDYTEASPLEFSGQKEQKTMTDYSKNLMKQFRNRMRGR